MAKDEKHLLMQEAANRIGMSRSWVRRAVDSGDIKSSRTDSGVRLIPESEVQKAFTKLEQQRKSK